MRYKKKTDKTLLAMSKKDLIDQIRILEHNWNCEIESSKNKTNLLEKIHKNIDEIRKDFLGGITFDKSQIS